MTKNHRMFLSSWKKMLTRIKHELTQKMIGWPNVSDDVVENLTNLLVWTWTDGPLVSLDGIDSIDGDLSFPMYVKTSGKCKFQQMKPCVI
jgi:hypothetical protein